MYSWLKTVCYAKQLANSFPTSNCDCLAACLMSEPSEFSSAVRPTVPIFEVAFRNGMWWSIPAEKSQEMYEKYINNQDVGYTWDWEHLRYGSWELNGEKTTINCYVIDFTTWEQRNIDSHRRRSVRLVWVAPERLDPTWTGHQTTAVLNHLHQRKGSPR